MLLPRRSKVRTGADVFETLVVDVADIGSSRAAAAELVERGRSFDVVLLNAGMLPNQLSRTADGIEMCFASSLIGHHIITTELLGAGLLEDASVVLTGSDAANNDRLGKMFWLGCVRLRARRTIDVRGHRGRRDAKLRDRHARRRLQRPAPVRHHQGLLVVVVGRNGPPSHGL